MHAMVNVVINLLCWWTKVSLNSSLKGSSQNSDNFGRETVMGGGGGGGGGGRGGGGGGG